MPDEGSLLFPRRDPERVDLAAIKADRAGFLLSRERRHRDVVTLCFCLRPGLNSEHL
jgi:hypothetical protein